MDALLGPIMDDLRACACSALEATIGGATTCACTLMPGTIAPADWCSCGGRTGNCGMTWVRLDRMYSSTNSFPSQDAAPLACAVVIAAVLEVGVYRCMPVSDAKGQPPSVVDQTQAALVQADDSMALLKAISCCDAITKRPHLIGAYTPRDGGGCGGGAWTVTVALVRR